MRRVWTLVAAVALTVADQLIKWWVQASLGAGRVIRFGGFMALRYVENTGAAFSILNDKTTLLSVATGILLLAGFCILLSGKIRNTLLYVAVTMILSGGIGNLIDRIRLGYVVDFIEPLFMNFAVFNFADCLITVGAGMMVLWLILDTVKEKKKSPKDDGEGTAQ